MKVARLAVVVAIILGSAAWLHAQTAPNVENGWKPYGSYEGSTLDTVNLMNGNLMLHIPNGNPYPQRGKLDLSFLMYTTSKSWMQISGGWHLLSGGSIFFQRAWEIDVKRLLSIATDMGVTTYSAMRYQVVSGDGGIHDLFAIPGAVDANGRPNQFESIDGTGYHVSLGNLDSDTALPDIAVVTDRAGIQHAGFFDGGKCSTGRPGPFNYSGEGIRSDAENRPPDITGTFCTQLTSLTSIIDSNGNQIAISLPDTSSGSLVDSMGRSFLPETSTDSSGCVGPLTFASAWLISFDGPNGGNSPLKLCYGTANIATSFGVPGIAETQAALPLPTMAIRADGSQWAFTYDSYANVASVTLPTGGSIAYTWDAANISCNGAGSPSRVVTSRTLTDNNGHSYTWHYHWGTLANSTLTNIVTDPLNNDTVHIFTALGGGCIGLHETSTLSYQGPQSSGQLLKRVDTAYGTAILIGGKMANVFPTSIQTTVYPSGKVSLITKQYDAGFGAGAPIFGNVVTEKVYDWGQGAPGALLRETDSTYQWQANSAYLTAHLVDLPASVIVKDGTGCAVAETDYAYDEAQYLTPYESTVGALPAGTHVSPPAAVRGNLTSVTKWLAPAASCNPRGGAAITSHTNWYDTAEVYQQIDPLGHTTVHSYDPAYAGAYSTQTCSPQTGSVAHCVSGTYDFNTGLLTSLTNENAATQASGNTPGDGAHTSNFSYDSMFRIISVQAPPDPDNSGLRATTSFNFSPANSFPLNVQRSKSVTAALSDSATSFFDGLGRGYKSQHVLPNGTATVDTTFDLAGHPATVSNPYFTTSDPTYGLTTSAYDGLDRVTQTTKQDGSISSVAYDINTGLHDRVPGANALGDCTSSIDEAGKQRRACSDALGRLVEVDEVNPGAAASHAGGSLLINGSEQSSVQSGSSGTGAVTISGAEQGRVAASYDHGTVSLIINGYTGTVAYGPGDTASTVASGLADVLHNDAASPVDASVSGATITMTARQVGVATNYSFTHSEVWNDSLYTSPSFQAASGVLSGGADPISNPDSGTITAVVNGASYTVSYGGGDTSSSVATRLAAAISAGAWANASGSGNQVNITSKAAGSGTNYTLSASFAWNNAAFANPSFTTSPSGSVLTGGYDAGLLDNQPFVTLYRYDALGNLTCVEQHGDAASGTGCSAAPSSDATSPWRVRRFTYDSFSRLLTAKNPESGTITYTYDSDGLLLQKTSPAPNQTGTATQTVSYCYDELHRVTGKGYGAQSCLLATPVVSYVYDSGANAIGHLTSLLNQAGTAQAGATYAYDILGRLVSETRTLKGANDAAISKTVSYEYNLDGSLYKLHYPSGAVVTYTPDSAGRPLSAVDSGSGINYVTSATFDPDTALTGFVSGSGGAAAITSSFTFNKRLQPLAMSATTPSQTIYSIGYDFHMGNGDNGNVFGITNYKDQNRNQTFAYDALNRLISAQNAGTDCAIKTLDPNQTEYWGNNYGYDAWGNLLQKSVTKCDAENLSVTADAHNWIHASGTDYQYDAAGNMTRNVTPTVQAYTYDEENRLTGAAGYTYTYDADGNRVRKSNGNLAANGTLYWYMTPGVVAESDLAGTLKSEYVFFDGERVARKDFPGNAVAYYFSDHLKTAYVITDSAGMIKAESDYYPWGGELQFVNNDSNDYTFTGKKRDTETGLDYFGARYYSNGLGRWVSADWSATPVPVPYADFHDPQSLNLYGFVGGNPASKADIDGHADDNKSFFQEVLDALNSFGDALQHSHMGGAAAFPRPQPCACPSQNKQDSKQNNNNSHQQSSTEQGRDAQGKFTAKQPGQSAPGSAAEKEGLDSVGAVKNKGEILNGTKRDGTIPETGQHVEVKSGASVNNTQQLQKMGQAAVDATGKPLKVVTTNPNVKVSGKAQTNKTLEFDHQLQK